MSAPVKERVEPTRLREHRLRIGLSQTRVGEMLGISEAAVNRHEVGQRKPNADLIRRYADIYGVRPIDLFVDLGQAQRG